MNKPVARPAEWILWCSKCGYKFDDNSTTERQNTCPEDGTAMQIVGFDKEIYSRFISVKWSVCFAHGLTVDERGRCSQWPDCLSDPPQLEWTIFVSDKDTSREVNA